MAALLDDGVISHVIELIKGGSGKQVHRELGVPDRQMPTAGLPTNVAVIQEEQHHCHHRHHHRHAHDVPIPKSHDPLLGGCPSLCTFYAIPLTFGRISHCAT